MVFTIALRVIAKDVNDTPVATGTVGISTAQQTSVQPPMVIETIQHIKLGDTVTISGVVKRILVLVISTPDFTTERARFVFDERLGSWQSDNPHVVAAMSASVLEITARIGCVRFAPVVSLDQSAPTGAGSDPHGVLIEPRGNAYAYRGLWLESVAMARLSEPIFGRKDKDDWDRFNHEEPTITGREHGSLNFLEFGFPPPNGPGRVRFLLAVWLPNKALEGRLDAHVFYSPNTNAPYPADAYPFTGAYPYQLVRRSPTVPPPPTKPPHVPTLADFYQPYVELGANYVGVGYKMIYQMIAARHDALIIMPIQPAGDWAVFGTRSGVWRMVLEVIRFAEARRLMASSGAVANPIIGKTTVTTSSADLTAPPVPPRDRSMIDVTLSSFSAGLGGILGVIGTAEPKDRNAYPDGLFASPEEDFGKTWSGLWDIDGGFVQQGGADGCVRTMRAWRAAGRNRCLRLYHSEDTFFAGTGASLGVVPDDALKKQYGVTGFVEEGLSDDRRSSWVLFSNGSLRTVPSDPKRNQLWPPFGAQDAHHSVPTMAFGHAWLVAVGR